jgi:hypothetical protein
MRLAGARLESELLPLLCHNAARLSTALGHCRAKEKVEKVTETSVPTVKPKRKTRKPVINSLPLAA